MPEEKEKCDIFPHLRMAKQNTDFKKCGFCKKTYILFFIFMAVFIFFTGFLVYQTGSDGFRNEIIREMSAHLSDDAKKNLGRSNIDGILRKRQLTILTLSGFILFGAVLALVFFIRKVARPLDEIEKTAMKMASGRLDELVSVNSEANIGKIGELINDLAINLQEILLHVWNHTTQDMLLLDRIAGILSKGRGGNGIPPEIKEDFIFVRQDIQDMQTMVKAFDYYHVRLEEEKVLVDEQKPVT